MVFNRAELIGERHWPKENGSLLAAQAIDYVWTKRNWAMKFLGRQNLNSVCIAVMAEMPAGLENVDRKQWAADAKQTCRQRYAFIDPFTLFLISIAIKIVIAAVVYWLEHRNDDDRAAIKRSCVDVLPEVI